MPEAAIADDPDWEKEFYRVLAEAQDPMMDTLLEEAARYVQADEDPAWTPLIWKGEEMYGPPASEYAFGAAERETVPDAQVVVQSSVERYNEMVGWWEHAYMGCPSCLQRLLQLAETIIEGLGKVFFRDEPQMDAVDEDA